MREKVGRSGEEREYIPVQKPTNEGREYLERCIQVKRGRRIRPREKERWDGRWIKKDGDKGKAMGIREDTHTYRNVTRDPKVTSVKIRAKHELRKAENQISSVFAIR